MSLAFDLHDAHIARHRRLWNTPPKVAQIAPHVGQHDAHVVMWRIFEEAIRKLREEAAAVIAPVARPRWTDIARQVIAGSAVTMVDLCSDRKSRPIVLKRHELCYRLATETAMSYAQIGRVIGNRHHTTIMHGVRAHALRNDLTVPAGLRR